MPSSAPVVAPVTAPPQLLARLIALWALSEALLGGVLHAFKLPVTGLFVGGVAVVILRLLGHYSRQPGTVLRGLLVVLTIKALLSPHTSPNAYVAVAFQGFIGELLSWGKAFPRLRGVLLGVLTMVESAGQRLLMLWLMGGKALPAAFNAFVQGLVGQSATTGPDYALWLVVAYLIGHALVGAGLGWWAGSLPARLPSLTRQYVWLRYGPDEDDAETELTRADSRPRKLRVSQLLLLLWGLGLALWLAARLGWPPAVAADHHQLGGLLLRSVLVYGAWTVLLGPLLTGWLRQWLTRPRGRWATDLHHTLALLPATRQLVVQCWRLSAGHQGWRRLRWFGRALGVNFFADTPAA